MRKLEMRIGDLIMIFTFKILIVKEIKRKLKRKDILVSKTERNRNHK